MRKKSIFIAINSLEFGGIQKSLVDFIYYLKDKSEIDLLIWDKRSSNTVLPDFVNVLKISTVKSVRRTLQENGFFSFEFFRSLCACFFKKRWSFISSPPRSYDIAIAYSHVGALKYYIIDKVSAKQKFAFYHHGAYVFNNRIRCLDIEYYKKYDIVFTVSKHIQDILERELSSDIKFALLPNLINVENIKELGKQDCPQMLREKGKKILTVGRLSDEKNILKVLEVCKDLKYKGFRFHWYIVGDGPQKNDLISYINHYSLEDVCTLCGSQANPYKYMQACDLYVQLSKYEAQPITIQEVAVFGKPMVLSKISGFESFAAYLNNILLVEGNASYVADCIMHESLSEQDNLDVIKQLQNKCKSIIDHYIFQDN